MQSVILIFLGLKMHSIRDAETVRFIPFDFAATAGDIANFFQTLPAKIEETFIGMGNRASLNDGIPQALDKTLQVMGKNIQEIKKAIRQEEAEQMKNIWN